MNIGRSPDPITAVPGSVSLVSFGTPPLDFALPGMSDVMPYSSSRFRDLSKEQLERYEKAFLEEIGKPHECLNFFPGFRSSPFHEISLLHF